MDYRNLNEHFSPSARQLIETNRMVSIITENEAPEARDLILFIDNDEPLYAQGLMPIYKNYSVKMKKGQFQDSLAAQGFKGMIDNAAKKYSKQFGGTWNVSFNTAVRDAVAKHYVQAFKDAFKNKEYDFMK